MGEKPRLPDATPSHPPRFSARITTPPLALLGSLSACPPAMAVPSHVLYQNAARDIVLIDIPASIAAAQQRPDCLLSTPPLQAPIELRDDSAPKPPRGRQQSAQAEDSCAQHAENKALIEAALAHLSASVPGEWCMPRKLLAQYFGDSRGQLDGNGTADVEPQDPETELESRLREWAAYSYTKSDDTAFHLQSMMAALGAVGEHDDAADAAAHKWTMSYRSTCSSTNTDPGAELLPPESEPVELSSRAFHNPEHVSLQLTIAQTASPSAKLGQEYRFTIPPQCTWFLSDSAHAQAFRTSLREVTNEHTLARRFDVVLLDPPWPNRSAKRKRAYEQVGGMPHVKKMLLKMDIDSYFERNALVGVWVTNKASLRGHVLGPGGLFDVWNVGLIEEWVWIKTTTTGEPIFDIDNAMRKPYEILFLGRAAPNAWTAMKHASSPRKRIIAAVPDIHSRKPCLKGLLEAYMAPPRDYSALEVFSRYLVSGWTSWGNEVLKYNWDKYWTGGVTTERA